MFCSLGEGGERTPNDNIQKFSNLAILIRVHLFLKYSIYVCCAVGRECWLKCVLMVHTFLFARKYWQKSNVESGDPQLLMSNVCLQMFLGGKK